MKITLQRLTRCLIPAFALMCSGAPGAANAQVPNASPTPLTVDTQPLPAQRDVDDLAERAIGEARCGRQRHKAAIRLRPTPASIFACDGAGQAGCGSRASGSAAGHPATGTSPGGTRSKPSK